MIRREKMVRCNSKSSLSTNVGENTETIPIDLLMEILSRSSAKTIASFRCVSKLWDSLLRQNYFTKSFLTSSSTRPRLLFAFKVFKKWHFFSSLQPQNLGEDGVPGSIFRVTADYYMSFSGDWYTEVCLSAYGFIYLNDKQMLKGKLVRVPMICNPSTGQRLALPKVRARNSNVRSFFCYDPIKKRLKVLCMAVSTYRDQTQSKEHQVLTLGDGKLSWRKIECSFSHYPYRYSWNKSNEICINGVLYYIARTNMNNTLIVCFDVRCETFSFIDVEKLPQRGGISTLLKYKGKFSFLMYVDHRSHYELWVLEDKEKDKWSRNVLPYTGNEGMKSVGITETGEIFWMIDRWKLPFYIYYCNVETKCVGRVELKGIVEKILMDRNCPEEYFTFTNHVENVMFL